MGIFNQQPNCNQSYSKENAVLLALKDLLARLARLAPLVIRVFKDPKVIRVTKVQKVIKVLDLVSHQGGIIIC